MGQAGQCFIDAGMSADYPESLHKKLKRYRNRIQTIFQAPFSTAASDYCALIIKLTGNDEPSVRLSALCLERGFNPVLFSRINILTFPKIKAGEEISHNRIFAKPP